jgi:hypothetical protein
MREFTVPLGRTGKGFLPQVRRVVFTAAAVVALMSAGLYSGGNLNGNDAQAAVESSESSVLRRLTELQYKNIIRDVFGPDIKIGGRFDPDMREEGLLEVGAGQASISASALGQYVTMARSVAEQVLDEKHRAAFVRCAPASVTKRDDACAKEFLSKAGRILYRRSLEKDELADLVNGAGLTADTLGDFYSGLQTSLATALQSPAFLFRWEVQEQDSKRKGAARIDSYSKAARLSFFLWNTTPDTQLLAAAESGDLHTERGLAREVDRMLASPRLEGGVRAFFYDMFGLDGMHTLVKDTTLYPKYSFKIAADAEEQTLRTVVDVLLTQSGDYRDVFTTPKTFLTRQLGTIYGVPIRGPSAGGTPDGWQPYEFAADDPRIGVLAQPSFLGMHSHAGRTSPTLRGKALREGILCQKVPDPPGVVDFNIVQDTENPDYKTVRQRLTAHATEPMCVGCHKITDPIGLAMENFDTVGGYREKENGMLIDTSGTVDGTSFDDAAGLAKAIHDHPATTSCLVNRVFSYAAGRSPTDGENAWLKQKVEKSFATAGYRIVPLLRQISLADAFFVVSEPRSAQDPTKSAAANMIRETREVIQ